MVAYHADFALERAGRTADVSSQRPGASRVQSNALGQGLHWGDYAVMAMYLAGTLGLGFIFRRRGADTEDYLLGGRRMPWWLTGVSYVASLLSTVSLVALPGEAFNHGLSVSLASLVEPFCAVATFFLFVRFYFRRKVFTPFTYLEERFDRRVRAFGSISFFFTRLVYIGLILFSSARVFEGAAGWSAPITITLVGVVAIIYVSMGGLRAEMWSDFFHFILLVGGVGLIVVLCISRVDGGVSGILSYARQHDRWFQDFSTPEFYSLDPNVRVTFWLILVSVTREYLFYNSADQISIQRLLSTGAYRQAKKSIWFVSALTLPVSAVLWFLGLAVFAYYGQHPVAGAALQGDTALFRFVATEMPPLVPGIFLSAMLAAVMSTIDSGLDSLATVVVKDFYVVFVRPDAPERAQVRLSRALVVFFGVLGIGMGLVLAAASSRLQATLIEAASITMALQGIIAPVFLIGVTTRRIVATDILRAVAISVCVTVAMIVWYLTSQGTANPVSFLFVSFPGLICMLVFGYAPLLWRRQRVQPAAGLTLWDQPAS
jgi:SSS family solute:Na+ symporter